MVGSAGWVGRPRRSPVGRDARGVTDEWEPASLSHGPSQQPPSPANLFDELGFEHRNDGALSVGRAPVLPGVLVPGTPFVRIGVLALLVDATCVRFPFGPLIPTVDLSVNV